MLESGPTCAKGLLDRVYLIDRGAVSERDAVAAAQEAG
jgi:hypothetical protein